MTVQDPFTTRHSPRGIFCSRTLNLRSISAIGYDMDYTLIHYNVMVIIIFFNESSLLTFFFPNEALVNFHSLVEMFVEFSW